MPPRKQKQSDATYPELKGQVDRWAFQVRSNGSVTVGTKGSGPHKRWTFQLSTYPEDGHDPAECVRREIRVRNEKGKPTPLIGDLAGDDGDTGSDAAMQPVDSLDAASVEAASDHVR
jgi:hypothetical protein